MGSVKGADSTGYEYNKIWLSTMDLRTRDQHLFIHNQKVKKGNNFLVNGESLAHPGDPSGSPENVINCRCTLAYEIV